MNEIALAVLSRCLRAFLYNHLALIFMFYLLYQACGPGQRFRWGVIAALLELRMLASTLVVEVIAFFYEQEIWYPLLRQLASLFHSVLAIFVLRYMEGHLGKTLFAALWTETFSLGCLMGAWVLTYWGTGEVYVMTGYPLHPRDALLTVLYLPLCVLCSMALTPILRFYRNYQFRHPRIVLGLALLITFSWLPVNFYSALPRGTYRLTVDFIFWNIIMILLFIIFLKQAKLRKEIYREQKRSVETHLNLLHQQAAWVTDSRIQLEEQITMVESLSRENQRELVNSYLAELKAQYHTFLAGIRCKDQLVDALLCYKEELCRQQGISTEFSLHQYDRGKLEEQEVAALLLTLFDGAIQSCQKKETDRYIFLYMAFLKGQLVVEMGYSGKQKLTKEGLRPILTQYDGAFFQERTKTGRRIKILLQAGVTP